MTEKITIRQATSDDASAIHDLHTQSVRELCKGHYSNDQISGWLDHRILEGYFPAIDQGRLFVAIEDTVIVGFGEAVAGEVLAIYVLPNRAKEGIGSMLLRYAMEIAQGGVHKVTIEATLNAIDFCCRRGFVEVERKFVTRGNAKLLAALMEYTFER